MTDEPFEPFCKLADPDGYRPCDWDLSRDLEGRLHWDGFFRSYFKTVLQLGIDVEVSRGGNPDDARRRAASAQAELEGLFDRFMTEPTASGRAVTMLDLDRWRDHTLRRFGFHDPFVDRKARENQQTLALLPTLCAQLDALPSDDEFAALIEGVFAGNIFDLGAPATARAFLDGSPDFFATRQRLSPRPWLIDDFDVLRDRMLAHVHEKTIFFIDNAGSDFLLGVLPFVRWMARRGTHVVLAANELPALNDMTAAEVRALWPRVLEVEPSLGGLPIEIVSTGTGDPLIDLSQVSRELNCVSSDADLVILEGMGRGVESNLDARFTCDALNLAMIKDPIIARWHGGKTFDLVCRFRAVGGP
jgi:type II pantothenate kinase